MGFVAQAETQRKVRFDAPVVLREHSDVHLVTFAHRLATRDGELGGFPAERSNLSRRVSQTLEQYRTAISFDGRDGRHGVSRRLITRVQFRRWISAGENERSIEIRQGRSIQLNGTQTPPETDGVRAVRDGCVVLQFVPVIVVVAAQTDRGAASHEGVEHVDLWRIVQRAELTRSRRYWNRVSLTILAPMI